MDKYKDYLNDDLIEYIYSKICFSQSKKLLHEIKNFYKIKLIKPFIIKFWNIWAINLQFNYNDIIWQINSDNPLYYISRIHYSYINNINKFEMNFISLPYYYYNEIINIINKDYFVKKKLINIFINKYILTLSDYYLSLLLEYFNKFKNKDNIYTIWHINI